MTGLDLKRELCLKTVCLKHKEKCSIEISTFAERLKKKMILYKSPTIFPRS